MKPNWSHKVLLLVGVTVVEFVPSALSAAAAPSKPNMLLVLSDDYSAPHVGELNAKGKLSPALSSLYFSPTRPM